MLPKKQRLNLAESKNKKIFKDLSRKSPHFKFYSRQALENTFKAAVVIPVKTVRKAAHRNKLRRWVYEIVEKHPVKNESLELVIVCSKRPEFNFAKVKKEVETALDNIIKNRR